MSTQKNLITLCFAAVFTLGLAACGGGGGGGEPPPDTVDDTVDTVDDTVEPMDNSADEAEIARLMGALATAMDNSADDAEIARLMGALATAMDNSADDAEIARLMGALATAMDNSADEAEIARLKVALATAMDDSADGADNSADEAEIARLMGALATAMDNSADDAEIARLMGALATAMDNSADDAEIARLEGELATAMDNSADDAEIARLMGALATAMDNSADDAEIARLEGALATAMDNSADDAEIARLMGALATAMDNSADDAEIARLEGELATAIDNSADEAEIARLEGELATAMDNSADEDEIVSLRDVAAAFATAYNARTSATAAATAATDAVTAAMEASVKITTLAPGVAGNSATAQANAQAVLDNRDAANKAVIDATTAKQNAENASGGTNTALVAALEEAIKAAEDAVDAATKSAESDVLKTAVELVTGADPDADDYPMMPAQHGKAVAMAIGGALMPMSDILGARMRGTHGDTDAPDATMFPDAVNMNNHVGSTWADIVGAGNITKMRIASSMTATEEVDAASIADQPSSSVTDFDGVGVLTGTGLVDGAQHPGAYKGIPGTVFCSGDDCDVTEDADGDTLTGSWFFTPDAGDEWYVRNAADTEYERETLYARFGHWLNVTSGDDEELTDINTYAVGGAGANTNTGSLFVKVSETDDALMDTSATYTGEAAGMSLHKEFDGQGGVVPGSLQSAAFTADVELMATFGDSATLGGTVSNFEGGATDPDWSVILLTRGFNAANFDDGTGTTTASGQNGVWTAQAFGPTGGRPTGIFGGFNAHFLDGHAAGAYATRK